MGTKYGVRLVSDSAYLRSKSEISLYLCSMKNIIIVLALSVCVTVAAQKQNFTAEKNGIKLTGVENPKTFLDAKLSYNDTALFIEPIFNSFRRREVIDTGKTIFNFIVDKYQLGAQTPDADQRLCANSAKGQHIHFILDNQAYQASYVPDITTSLKPGHHVLLAFLSRSYHESIKTKTAHVLVEFDAGKKGVDQFNEKSPHLFFSRPKGDYVGKKETAKVLLDFYLINCTLAEKGYKVRATINGSEFMLYHWEPYYIEGLPIGESKIKLELLDKNDKLVLCPFNSTERTIKLLEEPAAK